ncbi:MAG: hypothetical protein JNJ57_20645 [Saprospiraceae bacterium]|nr:hypothetical protein [Saprospiraceae bacterium]
MINIGNKHWKPGNYVKFEPVKSGTTGEIPNFDLPDYIGVCKLGTDENTIGPGYFFYFKEEGINAPVNEECAFTLSVLTLPARFQKVNPRVTDGQLELDEFDAVILEDDVLNPFHEIAFNLPILINPLERFVDGDRNRETTYILPCHLCDQEKLGIVRRVNEPCAHTTMRQVKNTSVSRARGSSLSTDIRDLMIFRYVKNTEDHPLVDGLYDFSYFYFTPLFMSNQTTIYLAFRNDTDGTAWIKEWFDFQWTEPLKEKFFQSHNFTLNGQLNYLDDLDIWVTFGAKLKLPKL